MYENNNFSGYGTGNENTTGTFSGADLNETRTENSYGYENHSTTQSAAGSTNGYTTYQMGGTTGSNNTEPKKTQKHGGYFRKAMVSVSLGLFSDCSQESVSMQYSREPGCLRPAQIPQW